MSNYTHTWDDALCRQITADPDWWHEPDAERDPALAARLCDGCPVLAACDRAWRQVEAGMPAHRRGGIWAGLTPAARVQADSGHARRVLAGADNDAPRPDPIHRGKRAMPRRRTSGRTA